MQNRSHPKSGFTLLEVVLVMGILAFLTINIAVNIQNAFRARARIQTKLEDFSRVRDSLKIIERDFNLAFHYRDLEEEFRAEIKKAQTAPRPTPLPSMGGFQPPPPPPAVPQPTDPREAERLANRVNPVTHFVGSDNEVNFVTSNTSRMGQDVKQADFMEVGYSLKSCRRPGATASSQCLVRRESPIVDDKVEEGGESTVLLEDVTEFKLRYFGAGQPDWSSDWNSLVGDAATKDAYPQAIEISLTIERGETEKKRKVSMQLVAGVRFSNNAVKEGQSTTSGMGIPGQ